MGAQPQYLEECLAHIFNSIGISRVHERRGGLSLCVHSQAYTAEGNTLVLLAVRQWEKAPDVVS